MEFPGQEGYWRKCGNSWSQLKKKRNFQGCSSKNSGGISMGVLVIDLGISNRGVTQGNFAEFPRVGESLFSPEFLRVKSQIQKFLGGWGGRGSRKLYPRPPPPPPPTHVWFFGIDSPSNAHPTFGSPTIPTFKDVPNLPSNGTVSSSCFFLGGILVRFPRLGVTKKEEDLNKLEQTCHPKCNLFINDHPWPENEQLVSRNVIHSLSIILGTLARGRRAGGDHSS